MSSWVHLLSRFTPEALLIEGILISLLLATYLGFWILRKRRFGAASDVVPAIVIKNYLSSMIGNAEYLQTQLFGLLRQAGLDSNSASQLAQLMPLPTQVHPAAHLSAAPAIEGASGAAGAAAHSDSPEQAALISQLSVDKARLENELTQLKTQLAETQSQQASSAQAASAGPASAEDSVQLAQLKTQLAALQEKLNEYSVIEDDLANLKQLQLENARLKAALEAQGAAVAAAVPTPAPTPAAPLSSSLSDDEILSSINSTQAITAAPETTGGDPMEALLGASKAHAAPAAAPAPAAPQAPAPAAAAPSPLEALEKADAAAAAPGSASAANLGAAPTPDFDALANALTSPPPASATETLPSGTQTTPPLPLAASEAAPEKPAEGATPSKSDADLVAEFEKMLNG